MPNDTRSGLKISGNGSYGGMNPPQSPDLNIIEAVWDHLDRERNKRQPTSKEELCPSRKPGELFLKTTERNDRKLV